MSPRTGRPISDNPKQIRVETRMTKEDLERLDFCCKVTGKTRSELVRESISYTYERLSKFKQK